MVDDATPAALGRHGLGPHVVGQRVVIRRIVPGETGPTGGPAFTDVLGVCERWSSGPDGEAVVRRADGDVVTIPTRLIVSGKPVPPRASRLSRLPREEIDAHLDQPGVPVWLGSVAQLGRRHGPHPEVSGELTDDRLVCTLEGREARACLRDDWLVVDRIDDPRLLGTLLEWAAEEGAGIVAFTDPRAAEFVADLVDRR